MKINRIFIGYIALRLSKGALWLSPSFNWHRKDNNSVISYELNWSTLIIFQLVVLMRYRDIFKPSLKCCAVGIVQLTHTGSYFSTQILAPKVVSSTQRWYLGSKRWNARIVNIKVSITAGVTYTSPAQHEVHSKFQKSVGRGSWDPIPRWEGTSSWQLLGKKEWLLLRTVSPKKLPCYNR